MTETEKWYRGEGFLRLNTVLGNFRGMDIDYVLLENLEILPPNRDKCEVVRLLREDGLRVEYSQGNYKLILGKRW